MGIKRNSRWSAFGLIAFGILLGIALVELGLRLWQRVGTGTTSTAVVAGEEPPSRYHEVLGWVGRPGPVHHYSTWGGPSEYDFWETYNSKGLPDREHSYEKPPGVQRILALGDSFTECNAVPWEYCWGSLLESRLNSGQTGANFEFIKAGFSGYSLDQYLLFYELEAHKYSPDIVLVGWFMWNDVLVNGEAAVDRKLVRKDHAVEDLQGLLQGTEGYRPKPKFELTNDGQLVLTHVPVPTLEQWMALKQQAQQKEPGSSSTPVTSPGFLQRVKGILRHSAVYRLTGDAIRRRLPGLEHQLVGLGLMEPRTVYLDPEYVLMYDTRSNPTFEAIWRLTESLARRLKEEVEGNGSKLVVVLMPDKTEVSDKHWAALKQQAQLTEPYWDRTYAYERTKRMLDDLGIRYIDLNPAMRAAEGAGQALYHERDIHWNPAGNKLAAETIYQELMSRGLLTGKVSP